MRISRSRPEVTTAIIEKAGSLGASLAGIAGMASLRNAPSCRDSSRGECPRDEGSFLVLALAHQASRPELDWWHGKGGTPGNHRLENIAGGLLNWLKEEFSLKARLFPYHAERGGVFLKDAAVLGRLGVVGKNNLLVTPEFGSRVRLRALALDFELEPMGPSSFAPCKSCDAPCLKACPQNAFKKGEYTRALCGRQMKLDEANIVITQETGETGPSSAHIEYCRACELACPAGE